MPKRRKRVGLLAGVVWAVGCLIGRIAHLVLRFPLTALVLAVGPGVGILAGHTLHITGTTQVIVSMSVPILVLAVACVWHTGYGAIYVIISDHPVSSRRVCAYVGLTTQRPYTDKNGVAHYPRIEQHLLGSSYYGKGAAPWADTVVSWHFAHESYHMIGVRKRNDSRGEAGPFLRYLERVHIRIRRPLYNWQQNGKNRRQIPKWTAVEQRAARDSMRMTSRTK